MANRWGKMETVTDVIFLGSKITADGDCSHEIKRNLLIGRKVLTNLDSIKKHRHHLTDKGPFSQSYGFSRSHVWMWVLDHKEGWVAKSWRFLTVVLEMSLESPLDCTEIKPVNPKGNQPWIFIGRTDAEASVLGPPDAKSPFFGKDLDGRKDGGQEEKAMTEDEMVGWHRWLDGHEFERAPGDGTDIGACCAAVHRVTESQTWLNDSVATAPPGAGCQGDTCVCLPFVWSQRARFIRKPPFGRDGRETLLLLTERNSLWLFPLELFFNCKIIASQCCVGFCHAATQVSCIYTYIPFFLSLPSPRRHPTPLGHHRAPSGIPCFTQPLPANYLFYIR